MPRTCATCPFPFSRARPSPVRIRACSPSIHALNADMTRPLAVELNRMGQGASDPWRQALECLSPPCTPLRFYPCQWRHDPPDGTGHFMWGSLTPSTFASGTTACPSWGCLASKPGEAESSSGVQVGRGGTLLGGSALGREPLPCLLGRSLAFVLEPTPRPDMVPLFFGGLWNTPMFVPRQ